VVAIRCDLADGSSDYFLSALAGPELRTKNGPALEGRNAFIRTDRQGALTALAFQEGTRVEAAGWTITVPERRFSSTIKNIQYDRKGTRLTLDRPLPEGTALRGFVGCIDASTNGPAGYWHNDVVTLEEVEKDSGGGATLFFKDQSLVLASVNIASVDPEKSEVQLTWGHGLAGKIGALSYKGHAVVASGQGASEAGAPLCLVREVDERRMAVSRVDRLKEGQRVDILVAKPGDLFEMPATVSLSQLPDGQWKLSTNQPATVTYPSANGPATREFPVGETVWKP